MYIKYCYTDLENYLHILFIFTQDLTIHVKGMLFEDKWVFEIWLY